ncbi:DNRLRE domain-containing protein [Chloroflexota bacterium]
MKREQGQALILVLILLAMGALVIVPVLQMADVNLKARMVYGHSIKVDYTAEASTEYALWKLRWDPGFAASLPFGVPSDPLYVTLNGITASSIITAEATEVLSGIGLIDHQIQPTKTVTPTTAVPGIPTTFTYTITLERLEPDDELFIPLQSIKDATDEGFIYVPNSSKLDGVPFDDDDLTILAEPVIITPQNFIPWSTIAHDDSMVRQDTPTQNYGDNLTMNVSAGGSGNVTDWSFLYFNLSSLPAAGTVIQSATLRLWAESYPDYTRTYDLHLVADNWTESSINWNSQPSVNATAVASADTADSILTPMEWNVTTEAINWSDNTTPNFGVRISDRYEGVGTANYTSTVVDTLEYDTEKGNEPNIIPISGDVYAIAYSRGEGKANYGNVTTVEISTSGNITDTVIDTLDFDAVKGKTPSIVPVSGDIYAIAYSGDGDDGFLKTIEITSSGNITDAVINTLEFDTLKGKWPEIIQIDVDTFAIAYSGDGDVGMLTTTRIKDDGTGLKVEDTLEFDASGGGWSLDIIPISGDIYAIAYSGSVDGGFLKTVEIGTNGQITDTVLDTLEFDTSVCWDPDIVPVSGDVYAIAYEGNGGKGFLTTVEIATSGAITDAVIDSLEFDTLVGYYPDIIPVSGDTYAIAYTGSGDDGYLETVTIANDGIISEALTNTPEYDPLKGNNPNIIPISGDVYAIAYSGDGDDGFLKTIDLVHGNDIYPVTVFHTKDDGDPGGEEPILVVSYLPLGGTDMQTIEWIFEPDLDFNYGQERTLSFESRAILDDDRRYWNAAIIQPNNSYTGVTANITVGNPPDTGIPGSGATVTKTADPQIVYAGIPTIVTYVISITNTDIGEFSKLDFIEDYLPPGFSYVVGSATLEWDPLNSTDNPAYTDYGLYYNIGDFEPDFTDDPSGRLMLKWHKEASANGLFPGDDELLHDRDFPAGVTYTQTFQALASVNVSGNYPNEVFVKLKDWNLYGDRGLGQSQEIYSWPTGEVVVPAYDILTEAEYTILRVNAAITLSGIEIRSWHVKKHK